MNDRKRLWERSWPLDLEACPCDVQFIEYLQRDGTLGKVIFHFGTGNHHRVGRRCSEPDLAHEVLGLTISKEEYEAYIDLVIREPRIGHSYKVLFADIYTLTARLLPRFDLVTLFHHGEFLAERRADAPHDDRSLVDLFLGKLEPGGKILFYQGSCGFNRTGPILADLVAQGRIVQVDEYKSLLIYQPRPASLALE
jgi:hypothetical protein